MTWHQDDCGCSICRRKRGDRKEIVMTVIGSLILFFGVGFIVLAAVIALVLAHGGMR